MKNRHIYPPKSARIYVPVFTQLRLGRGGRLSCIIRQSFCPRCFNYIYLFFKLHDTPPIYHYCNSLLAKFKNFICTAVKSPFYKSLTKQLPLLVELYDVIERELPEKYKEYKKAQGVANPRFGSVRGIESLDTPTKTEFLATPTKYSVSSGYIYPIFGAFRSLLRFDEATGTVSWLFDPITIWNEVGTSIVQNTFETYTNPQLAGKDKQLWLSNYRIVETQSLRKLLRCK